MKYATKTARLGLCFLIGTLTFTSVSKAQVNGEVMSEVTQQPGIRPASKSGIVGKVMEMGTNKAVEGATVQLMGVTPDASDSLLSITVSKANGDFSFANYPAFDSLVVIITSIGYESAMESLGSRRLKQSHGKIDLGNIELVGSSQQLAGVVLTAKRPEMQLGIDKKVFDVTQNLSAKGGTAVDVMQTIPSLSVDIDGNVTFRDNTPTIYINGRPTILTLDQIPSDDIDRIELVSNPSAKYEASSVGGIINIILKKDRGNGLNGIVSVAGGLPGLFRSNVNLNLRQGKLNFFVNGGYSNSGSKARGSSDRQNKDEHGSITDLFSQRYVNNRDREFKYIRGGVDFYLDNRNIFTVQQGYTQGDFDNDQFQNQRYMNAGKALTKYGERYATDAFQFRRNNSQFNYTHEFPGDEHKLDIGVTANYGGVKTESDIRNDFFTPDGEKIGETQVVTNDGKNNSTQWTAQADYVRPAGKDGKMEMGVRADINDYNAFFNSYGLEHGEKIKLPLSNDYLYKQWIYGAYYTYTDAIGNFGYQVGLRGEYTKFDGTLLDRARSFGYKYPSSWRKIWDALFPSVFLSQKLDDHNELQLNYSRRTTRPSMWELNPFIDINDPQNIRQGNPELHPEFTNSLEFNYSWSYGRSNNLLVSLYHHNTLGSITRFSDTLTSQQYEQLQNSAVDPDAILNTFINAKSKNNTGVEFILQQGIAKGLKVTPSFRVQYRSLTGETDGISLSRNGVVFRSKLQASYEINTENDRSVWDNMAFQLDGQYRSSQLITQGKELQSFSMDLSVKKDVFAGNKGSIVFSVNDVFDSRKRGIIYDMPTFYQKSYSRWRTRSFRLTFSYRFGDNDFKLFKGGNDGDGGFDS